jgi:hypothetical protein
MKQPKIDDYGVGNGYVDLLKFSKDLGKHCDELESRFKSDIAIKLELKTDNFLLKQENEELRAAIDKMYVLCIGKHYDKVEDILNELSTKTEMKNKGEGHR